MRRLVFVLLFASVLSATAQRANDDLIFQTNQPWSPRVNVESGTVMAYGIDKTLPDRIASWRAHGYRVTVMTGVAWGEYGDYLRGDFDGKEHWNETQQEKSGKLIQHSGREVPYVAPSESYGRYLAKGVERALDAGAEAIYLEEPEFWARAGWSDSFKHEWQSYYNEPWQAPDSSADAQYRASKLKYVLYRRALAQVFASVKVWSAAHRKRIPCYVATHSLINYAQWSIVSPESSLIDVGADGYIAQVWTGTSREPNVYEGERKERTFETAFLEYGAMQNLVRVSGKRMWFLNDPIEDNPNHSWTDYQRNWESTLVASLLQPHIASYEIIPWPDRIFGPRGLHIATEPTADNPKPEKVPISHDYETELQIVFHALGQLGTQRNEPSRWLVSGTHGIGVLVSDTLMFQRAQPTPSDPNLGNIYGLALPLLMRGIPVEPVQIENATGKSTPQGHSLAPYRMLLLTYEGQKPPTAALHTALAAWVRAGGALVVVDDDKDPYNRATDWWNSGTNHFASPREDLFQKLNLDPHAEGQHRVGKGLVIYAAQSPSALTYKKTGADTIRTLTHQAADTIHLPWTETSALVLRRGPFLIAAGLDGTAAPLALPGHFLNLFDPNLAETSTFQVAPTTRALLFDLNAKPRGTTSPSILVASAKIANLHVTPHLYQFTTTSIEGQDVRDFTRIVIHLRHAPQHATLDGKPLETKYKDQILRLEFPAHATPQTVAITF